MSDKEITGQFSFSRKELAELLGVDAVPSMAANFWNSLVVCHQIDSPNLSYLDSVIRTEFLVRQLQEGEDSERVYHGKEANLITRDHVLGTSYYEISTGYGFERSGNLEVGKMIEGTVPVAEAIGVLPPSMYFPTEKGVTTNEAGRIYFDYSKSPQVDVHIRLNGDGIGLADPVTRDEVFKTLQIFGDAVRDVKAGKPVDFQKMKQRLKNEVGLADYKRPEWMAPPPAGFKGKPALVAA